MGKIDICERKKLKLTNVIIKKINNIKLENLNKEVEKFINFIEISKIQTKGPLITKNSGTKINDNGDISFDYEIMIQAIRRVPMKAGFIYKDSLVAGNCIYAHFEGTNDELSYAQNKINLHIWENNLIENGEEYMVHLESSGDNIKVDIFKPVEI